MSTKGWLIIGIAGATCSGKTTLSKKLNESIKNSIVINQDEYFLPISDPRHKLIPELNHFNWEIITALDMTKMLMDVESLLVSKNIENKKTCDDKTELRVLIMDGFLLFNSKELTDLCDLRYFVDMTKEQCWERRKVRVYDPPDVPNYFDKIVWPEYVANKMIIQGDKNLNDTITYIDGSQSIDDMYTKVFNDVRTHLTL